MFLTPVSDPTPNMQLANLEADGSDASLSAQNLLLAAVVNSIKLGVYIFDETNRLMMINDKAKVILNLEGNSGLTAISTGEFNSLILKNLGELSIGQTRLDTFLNLTRSTEKTATNLLFQSGRVLHVTHTPIPQGGFVHTWEDVTDRRKAEAKASHLASHDALTDLPNRRLLKQHIDVALSDSAANCAVLCIDIDRFKTVNDTVGHGGGDALLIEATKRLRECVRAEDTVGRLGGEKFVILIANLLDQQEAYSLAERVIKTIAAPFEILGHSVIVSASVGIALAPQHGENPDRLIKCADMALFEAKRNGRGQSYFFESNLETKAIERRALEIDLRRAVKKEQFELHYQPVFAARQRKLVGFEALLRWNHPTRGRVSPLDFIPVAEELGLITELGDWIINEACRTAATWPSDIVVAVNVSARQFVNHDLFSVVNQALADHNLPPSRLEIEITESALMESGSEIANVLQRLRDQGIAIAMDDFGTGYSSLAYLRRFHFTKVKIDRSFVQGLASEAQSIAIVRAILALCKSLHIVVTAEGVETAVQADILRKEDCDYLQGYLLGKPTPVSELHKIFAEAGRLPVIEKSPALVQ
jgi:diguanylate cyclase (GGDEF)-like protein